MPRIPIDPKHKTDSPFDFPKLRLEKNERARIIAIEELPLMEYVHSLSAPVISNGQVLMEPDGDTTKVKEEFLGRYICLGDPGVLEDKGQAPDSCPVCRAATETDAVSFPDRRFAMHVVQYGNLKPGTWEVQAPFTVTVKAWLYTDRIYSQLVGFKEEVGDLRLHDLLLGPCENPYYQKFDIRPSTKRGVWLSKDEFKQQVGAAYRTNQTPYLEALIGRRSRENLEQELQRVVLRYQQAYGGGATAEDTADVIADADALLGGGDDIAASVEGASVEDVLGGEGVVGGGSEDELAGILGGDGDAPAPAPAEAAAPEEAASSDGESGKADFAELLGELPQ
jgi:hypothetical protein